MNGFSFWQRPQVFASKDLSDNNSPPFGVTTCTQKHLSLLGNGQNTAAHNFQHLLDDQHILAAGANCQALGE